MRRSERRMFERFEVDFPVGIRHSEEEDIFAECRDFSASGIGLWTAEGLTPNTSMEVSLGIPDGHLPFRGTIRIIWSQQVQADKWRSGVEFETADFMGIRRAFELLSQK